MEAIALYTERRLGSTRTIRLYSTSVHIELSSRLQDSGEQTVSFDDLNPTPARLRLRNRSLESIYAFSMLLVFIAVLLGGVPFLLEIHWALYVGAFCIPMILLPLGFFIFPRIDCVQYRYTSGVLAFAISGIGNDQRVFERFASLVQQTIQKFRKPANHPAGD